MSDNMYEAVEEKAKKIVKEKMKFLRHAVSYFVVIGFLFLVNNKTYSGYQWWIWPALGWGIGLVSHFFKAFFFNKGSLEERMIRREMDRLNDAD